MKWFIAYMFQSDHNMGYSSEIIFIDTDIQFLTEGDLIEFQDDMKKKFDYRQVTIINAFRII